MGPWEEYAPSASDSTAAPAGPWSTYKKAEKPAEKSFGGEALSFAKGAASRLLPFPDLWKAETYKQQPGETEEQHRGRMMGAISNAFPTAVTDTLEGTVNWVRKNVSPNMAKLIEDSMAALPPVAGEFAPPSRLRGMSGETAARAEAAKQTPAAAPAQPTAAPGTGIDAAAKLLGVDAEAKPAPKAKPATMTEAAKAKAKPAAKPKGDDISARMAANDAEIAKLQAEIEARNKPEVKPAEAAPTTPKETAAPETKPIADQVKEVQREELGSGQSPRPVQQIREELLAKQSKPSPTVTATETATGETKTFTGQPGQPHAAVVLEHNLDSGAWEMKSSDWAKGDPVTPEEVARLKAKGIEVKEVSPTRDQAIAVAEATDPKPPMLDPGNERGSIMLPVQQFKNWISRQLTPRQLTEGTIREFGGERARKDAQIRYALESEIKRWEGKSQADSLTFMHNVETGGKQIATEDQQLHALLRSTLKDRERQVQALGHGYLETVYENYFPHFWEKPGLAQDLYKKILGGKRPLEGPLSLKQRKYPTIADGVAAGLKPLTYNPVEMALFKISEMDRFIMAHKIKDKMIEQYDLPQFVRFGHPRPEGFAPLDDRIFKVMQYSPKEKGFIQRGQYYAPAEAAKSFNNYLSPGLKGKTLAGIPLYDIMRKTGNVMNQAQLGLSAFHAGFTTIETGVSDVALGVQKASRGDVSAVKPFARAFTGASFIENPFTGNAAIAEYLNPGSRPKYARTAEMLAKAGGRVFQDAQYTNAARKAFARAWKDGDYGRVALKLIPATLESMSAPMLDWLVPRQKVGVFHKLAEDILGRADKEAWPEERLRSEIQKAWDSVDNREGQMVYDNKFWHKTMKDLSFASIRSVGWNAGSVSEFGGGIFSDLPKEAMRAASGQGFDMTTRMAYSIALPIYVGFLGAVYNYMATGEAPKELKDYYYPRTGRKDVNGQDERITLPTYVKDVVSVYRQPWQTVKHKLHPLVSSIGDMLENKDFYGTEIRNTDESLLRQRWSDAKFMAEQFLPFSVRNAQQRARAAGEEGVLGLFKPSELPSTAQTFVGIIPAPKFVTQSPAEQLAVKYSTTRVGQGPHPAAEQQHRDTIKMIENRIRLGKSNPEELGTLISQGRIAPQEVKRIFTEAKTPYLIRSTTRLRLDEALNVWDAADAKERKLIKGIVLRKVPLLSHYPMEEREALVNRIKSVAQYSPGQEAQQ